MPSRLRDRLRLSNEEAGTVWRASMRSPAIWPRGAGGGRARRTFMPGGAPPTAQRVLMDWARSGDAPTSNAWRHRYRLPESWQPPKFPIGGADVMALGIPAGPRIGEILRALETWWIEGDFVPGEDALRSRLKELTLDARRT